MYRPTLIATVLLAAVRVSAAADCELSSTVQSTDLSPQKLAIRGAIYQELCKRSGGTLIDGDSVQPKEALTLTNKQSKIRMDWVSGQPIHQTKTAVLAYIVETTGLVSWVSVLESSGDSQLDAQLFKLVKSFKFDTPMLSGQPVRVFLTIPFKAPQ